MAATKPRFHQINSLVTNITDPLIELNADQSPSANNAHDMGLIMNRGASGNNVAMIWDRSVEKFALIETTATGDNTNDINVSGYKDLQVGQITSSGITYPTIDGVAGQVLTTDGSGNVTFQSVPSPAVIDGGTF